MLRLTLTLLVALSLSVVAESSRAQTAAMVGQYQSYDLAMAAARTAGGVREMIQVSSETLRQAVQNARSVAPAVAGAAGAIGAAAPVATVASGVFVASVAVGYGAGQTIKYIVMRSTGNLTHQQMAQQAAQSLAWSFSTINPLATTNCAQDLTACAVLNPTLAQATQGALANSLPYDENFEYVEAEKSLNNLRAWTEVHTRGKGVQCRPSPFMNDPDAHRKWLNNELETISRRAENVCDPLKFVCSSNHSFWDVRSIMRSISECEVHRKHYDSCTRQSFDGYDETDSAKRIMGDSFGEGIQALFSACRERWSEIFNKHDRTYGNIPGRPGTGGGSSNGGTSSAAGRGTAQ